MCVPIFHSFVTAVQTLLSQDSIFLLDLPDNSESYASPSKKRTVTSVLMQDKNRMAKIKNLKVFSKAEIDSAKSETEKKRRRFCNEKAEQVARDKKTGNLDKTTMTGIIAVSWTLRKTSFIEDFARKTLNDEKVLFRTDHCKKLSQKKDTIKKNIDRMAIAHSMVEQIDNELVQIREHFQKAKSVMKREAIRKKLK